MLLIWSDRLINSLTKILDPSLLVNLKHIKLEFMDASTMTDQMFIKYLRLNWSLQYVYHLNRYHTEEDDIYAWWLKNAEFNVTFFGSTSIAVKGVYWLFEDKNDMAATILRFG